MALGGLGGAAQRKVGGFGLAPAKKGPSGVGPAAKGRLQQKGVFGSDSEDEAEG